MASEMTAKIFDLPGAARAINRSESQLWRAIVRRPDLDARCWHLAERRVIPGEMLPELLAEIDSVRRGRPACEVTDAGR
jgi:hypothetical protein